MGFNDGPPSPYHCDEYDDDGHDDDELYDEE